MTPLPNQNIYGPYDFTEPPASQHSLSILHSYIHRSLEFTACRSIVLLTITHTTRLIYILQHRRRRLKFFTRWENFYLAETASFQPILLYVIYSS